MQMQMYATDTSASCDDASVANTVRDEYPAVSIRSYLLLLKLNTSSNCPLKTVGSQMLQT